MHVCAEAGAIGLVLAVIALHPVALPPLHCNVAPWNRTWLGGAGVGLLTRRRPSTWGVAHRGDCLHAHVGGANAASWRAAARRRRPCLSYLAMGLFH
jgi:hypothetical protein